LQEKSVEILSFEKDYSAVAGKETENLVNRLKEWAKVNDKSQSEIAALLEVDRRRVHDWFNGKTPSLEHGLKIHAFLQKYGKLK
jgi:predicted XRE-type DNA-binding protein